MAEDNLWPKVIIGHSTGDHVSIQVLGRLHVGADDYWDGNWLITPVEIAVGGFAGDIGASLRAEEFRAFRNGLERLNSDFEGEAILESMEGWLSLVLRVEPSGGLKVAGRATDRLGGSNRLSFSIDDMDQSYLLRIIGALDEVENLFPVVGAP